MNRSYFKWIVAAALACVGIVTVFMWNQKDELQGSTEQVSPLPISPFKTYISAVGIVEARGGNIFIGSPVNRVIDKVEVSVGQKVKKDDILFKLESKDLKADLDGKNIDYENALANLKKLESLPRKEDVTASEAVVNIAKTELEQAQSQYDRVAGLQNSGAMSQEEITRRQFALKQAEAKYAQAKADLEKVSTGAWLPDLEIAKLQVKQSEAQVLRVEADIERTIIRSPIDGTVLQVKILPGEFPPTDSSQSPPMIIGNIDTLNLRVNINQFDASYYDSKAPAIAHLQGNATIDFPLHFENIEPYFVTKQVLSNDITEKVDTRVLQAIYCFEEGENRVFVGQQMDVFIETNFPATAP